ncbi:hypothetical protein VMUT_1185 [Vulcanisaeta moutnovskia 768-28]|uniref:Uncharacterized protein n=1 Tax=Vulcanisaeta moutnovskia (strain 768-28) TaxID=985053 RepID=F0QYF7_VULM7|nr:hypothetical protein [Vulcanisaeta moutnovskia]ADY01390.1 hypothetical protein VMUT_1185 [Vulcanisaeta moutnovskia 768-28]
MKYVYCGRALPINNDAGLRTCMVEGKTPGTWFKYLVITASLLTIVLLYIYLYYSVLAPTPHGNANTVYLGHDLSINYTESINYFRDIGGLVIIVGPQKLYNEIYQRALGLGITNVYYAGLNLSEALALLMYRPSSILIIDLPYIKMSPAELSKMVVPYVRYGIIAFYNASPVILQDYALNVLLRAEVINNVVNGHYIAFIPYLAGGPPFSVEAITDYGNGLDMSIGYKLSLRGLMFVLYEQTHDTYYDPCTVTSTGQLNLPGGSYYESPTFNDYGSPYSDSYISDWYYDFCIYYPSNWEYTATVPDYINLFPYEWVDVQPQSSYSLAYYEWTPPRSAITTYSMGIAIDYSSSWYWYSNGGRYGNGLAPISGPQVFSSPSSISSTTSSDPANVVHSDLPVVSNVYSNDTWSLMLSSAAFGGAVQFSAGDNGVLHLPSTQTEPYYTGYLPVDGNFTIESQEFPSDGTQCMYYYYYAIQLRWYVIYGTSPTTLSFNNESYVIWSPALSGTACFPVYPH